MSIISYIQILFLLLIQLILMILAISIFKKNNYNLNFLKLWIHKKLPNKSN